MGIGNHEKHGWVWVWYFQEHGYAPIDTNAYVMGIGNHEKHEWVWVWCFQEHGYAPIGTNVYGGIGYRRISE